MHITLIILTWLPIVFFGVVFVLALLKYIFRSQPFSVISYKSLVVSSISFRVFYAILLTVSQYYIWSKQEFTKFLVDSPGYFIFYSYGRFWLNVFIAVGVAFAFYLFLKFLKKYQERFFEEGETELGFLTALIVGWPNFVIFIPLVFISVVLISLFRRLVLKEVYTTLGWPFLIAVLITLILGDRLIQILNLGVLRI